MIDDYRDPITRRRYLIMRALLDGADSWLALESVSSCAIDHPEWDMDELRTFDEWETS